MDALFIPPGFDPALAQFLDRLLLEVRERLAQFADPNESTGRNGKGDIQRAFDLAADELVRRRLAEFFPSALLTTEEQDDVLIGAGPPAVRIVVDPVDGSDNWRLGLPLSALCISAFPPDETIDTARQCWAFAGDLRGHYPSIYAARGAGAYADARRLAVRPPVPLKDAYLSLQLSHQPDDPGVLRLLGAARSIRCYGSAAHDVLWVARGALDAHVDVRSRLTPESFLAAALAVEEAGGCIVGRDGGPLPPFAALTDKTCIIAASNANLAEEIARLLRSAT